MPSHAAVRASPAAGKGAAAPSPAPGDLFNCLTDEMLGRVFAELGRDAGPVITLVCRRWRSAFYAEKALWRELELARHNLHPNAAERKVLPWFASKRALLRNVGSRVQRFVYLEAIQKPLGVSIRSMDRRHQQCASMGTGFWLDGDVLASLSPPGLTSLELQLCLELEPEALQALEGLTALQELTLSCADAPLPPGMVSTLSRMRKLRALQLTAASLPDGLPAAASRLQQLSLDAASLPDSLLPGLQGLTALTRLECRASQLPSMQLLSTLSQLRHLGWLERQRERDSVLLPTLQQLLACLPGLQSWTIGSTDDEGGSCMELGGVQLYSCTVAGWDQSACSVRELSLVGVQGQPTLQQAVVAALPAGAQPDSLRSLALTSSKLAAQPLLCPHLASVTRLYLDDCRFVLPDAVPAEHDDDPWAAQLQPSQQVPALLALLHQAARVQDLSLCRYFGPPLSPWEQHAPLGGQGREEELPIALLYSRGLRHLKLARNRLTHLPAGPYLRELKSLELDNNRFTSLPPALSAATALTSLSLRGNRGLKLTAADVEGVLRRLLSLRELHTWELHGNTDWAALERCMQWVALISKCPKERHEQCMWGSSVLLPLPLLMPGLDHP